MIVRSMRKLKNLNYSQMSTLSAFIKIAEAEQKLQLKFSKEFKEYLLIFGVAKGNGHVFTGLSSYDRLDVVTITKQAREDATNYHYLPSDCYVVEDTGLEGLLILQNETGEIFEIAPLGKPKKIFDSFQDYIDSICNEE